jgi:hypothetical protein
VRRLIVLCAAVGLAMVAVAAKAESCTKSRDFILIDSSDLPQKAAVYQELFKNCMDTLQLSNVQDAFVLKVGAIAVVPKRDTVAATASTLAQFCERFPRGTLHFIKQKDRSRAVSASRAVEMTAVNPTPCEKIKGGG